MYSILRVKTVENKTAPEDLLQRGGMFVDGLI